MRYALNSKLLLSLLKRLYNYSWFYVKTNFPFIHAYNKCKLNCHGLAVFLVDICLRFFLQKLSYISKFLPCVCWQFLLFSLSLLFPSQFPNILVKNVPWQIFMSNLAFEVSCILYEISIQILFVFKYVVQRCHMLWNISKKIIFFKTLPTNQHLENHLLI